ncbi:serine/threonine-protein kinase [Gluconacetobacter diazotrophicus]|uniref:Putative serine/threonine protein kinase n=1 Tax=Gluconacetobacter diazotrophicus (strain ATCC 49037 / DSM 5601 / CCUG 37298 / CIP 103539 / LMG 7603 / PAl5) TaxID=272568 RepID=A9HC66_GLUDA|nr:serine/threonine-protein kinase [Gluconacetobacter diazotrophicus]CAP54905.1 putative serine/threonine protein kinase [Gluconacetobacter diazotrophicus PA1 5]
MVAQVYGERWKLVCSVGQGGQGDVFKVIDIRHPEAGPYALKRVRNPKRRQRFEAEVAAIEQLHHPNIIRLIDHSALGTTDCDDAKQFLVMPLARGGDLASRVKVYKDSLDGAVAVALPLASALSAAHAKGIVHRDVKPGNVIFADEGNDPWLTDFGICLIRNTERATATHEVAGPWAFMAPEVEHGGQLNVTAAADVYSLGKLLYFMVSGGTVLPRERLDDPRYAAVLSKGGRFHLLDLLLRRMVCEPAGRLQTMAQVEDELKRIAAWDRMSIASPFSEAALKRLEALQRSVADERREKAERDSARQDREAIAAAMLVQLRDFTSAELEKAAAALGTGAVLATSVQNVAQEELGHVELNELVAVAGTELAVGNVQTEGTALVLQLLICRSGGTGGPVPIGNMADRLGGLTDVIHIVIPRVLKRYRKGTFSGKLPIFFIGTSGHLQAVPTPPKPGQKSFKAIVQPQAAPAKVFATEIASSQWPELAVHLKSFVGSVLDSFLQVIERNRSNPFLS